MEITPPSMSPQFRRSSSSTEVEHLALSTRRDVTYSCGYCGYELNLSSCNRNTTSINSSYGKAIKKGLISFDTIDESRFSRRDVISYRPYFLSRSSWGLVQRMTKLSCRKCGNYIGKARKGSEESRGGSHQNFDYISESGNNGKVYSIRIGALRPSSDSSVILDI